MSGSGNLDGHLGEGMEVKGTLRFEGSVRIDGKFHGKIVSPATLILGPAARVDGELEVSQLAVHGALKGSVKATDRVTIHSSGKVEADLDTQKLVIEPGAFFQGRCDMRREAPPKPAPKPTPEAKAPASSPKPAGSAPKPAPPVPGKQA